MEDIELRILGEWAPLRRVGNDEEETATEHVGAAAGEDDDSDDDDDDKKRPLFDAPTDHAGVGNMSQILTTAAFNLGGVFATSALLGLIQYLPFPWFVIDVCLFLVVREAREWFYDRWSRRSAKERQHLRASRGLFFNGRDFFLAVLFGGAYALIMALADTTVDMTAETWPVLLFFGVYLAVLLAATMQLPFAR